MLTSERENLPSPTRPTFVDLDNVGTHDQVKRPRVIDPDKTSSSNWTLEATTSSRTPSTDNHSATDQVKCPRVIDPDRTSRSNWSSSRMPSDIHFVAVDSSSTLLEPT